MSDQTEQAQLLAEDELSRARALELASFIVEAPAGAGKTELLTQRYLRLLAHVNEPEEILAITFTNKAASEMRNRILVSLERAASGIVPPEPHKRITFDLAQTALQAGSARGWRLREQPARLRIFTIDALCASLARQMPFLSRFGAQPRISDDAQRHYAEAARRTLALLDQEEAGDQANVVAEALRHYDNNTARLSDLLASMLARRDQWLRHCVGHGPCEEAEAGLAALVQRDLERAAACVNARLQGLLMPAARYAAANLSADSPLAPLADWSTPLLAEAEFLPQWRALCELLLTKTDGLRKAYTKNNGLPAGKVSEPYKKLLFDCLAGLSEADAKVIARIRKLPDPRYSEEEWLTVEVMAQMLKLAAVQLWAVFNEQGEADFVEVAQRALQALGEEGAPSDLALQLDYRIQHLLVDEFQDTSPLQVELLQRLTAGWQDGDGRTLFAVGDPMQSIYRFRKADVGLFLCAAESGIGNIALQPLRLYRNNRSCAEVVDWINQGFTHIFPAQDSVAAGAIRYRPFIAARADMADANAPDVYVHALAAASGEPAGEVDQREAACILDIIARERAVDPTRSIAVLVRARSHLEALVALIRRQQPALRFQAVEIERLAARQPVQDLLSLTHALHHRADRVHWLAVLRAPWCGLRLADLHALAADDQLATVWQLMNDEERVARLTVDGRQRLLHVRGVLAEAYAHQGRARLRRWVEGVWLKLGGAACLPAQTRTSDIADVRAYLDLLDALDAAGNFSLDRLEDEVAELYAAPDALADGTLQFMTIHKSKGLEFDSVILPGLQRKPRGEDKALMLWEEVALDGLHEHLVAAPYGQRGQQNDSELPTPYDYLRLLEQERSANETTRVLYVAATRAIRRLHLVGVAKTNKDGEAQRPANSFLDLLWDAPGVAAEFALAAECLADEQDEGMDGDRDGQDTSSPAGSCPVAGGEGEGSSCPQPFVPRLVRLVAPTVPTLLQGAPVREATMDEVLQTRDDEAGESMDATDPLAADVGTLLHAYLEMIAGAELAAWDGARITALLPAMTLWFNRRGHGGSSAQEGAQRVAEALSATLTSATGRWLLAAHDADAAELALTNVEHEHGSSRGRGHFVSHVVDRCFVADGQRWIIDYKTARLSLGDGLRDINSAALRAHAERYRAQLERYANLFADEGLPLRLAIFYASYGELVELELAVS